MKHRKILLVLADGIGDRPSRRLDGMTPLQAAQTPNIDEVMHSATCGLLYPIAPGVTPGSDTSHLSLFGYNPYEFYRGRGPFEAVGAGIDVRPGDVAFRGNFATVDSDLTVTDRRAGRTLDEAGKLAAFLSSELKLEGVEVIIRQTTEHRFAVVLRGDGLSDAVSDTDPHAPGEKLLASHPTATSPDARRTAEIVNQITAIAHEKLDEHELNQLRRSRGLPKANAILLRGAGSVSTLPSFSSKYGLSGFCVTGTAMIRGFARMAGLTAPLLEGATGDSKTDVGVKAKAAIKALQAHEFVYVHFKATDAAGHDRNPELKVEMVQKLDQLVGLLLNELGDDVILCVSGDHSTPVDLGEHSADPVPILIRAPDVYPEGSRFTERSCAFGGFGRLKGAYLMPILLNHSNRITKYGE